MAVQPSKSYPTHAPLLSPVSPPWLLRVMLSDAHSTSQPRSEHELSLLKSKLSDRSEAARRASHQAQTLAALALERQAEKEEVQQDTLDITADLTRQCVRPCPPYLSAPSADAVVR